MLWERLSAAQRARHLIRALRTLTRSDGEIATEEVAFVTQVGLQQGLSLGDIQAELSSGAEAEAFPREEPARMAILYYLVFLSSADGSVAAAERLSIHRFGLRLGFREEMIDQFLDLADEHGTAGVAPTEMLARIRQYLN